MTINSALTHAEADRLAARIAELEHERKLLLAVIEILKEASSSLHFIDILQAIARKLGESSGLDRCSIFLGEKGGRQVRLVASYEDPTIRNYVVDLNRYPERSEEHTSELQSQSNLVCRLLLEKKKTNTHLLVTLHSATTPNTAPLT